MDQLEKIKIFLNQILFEKNEYIKKRMVRTQILKLNIFKVKQKMK